MTCMIITASHQHINIRGSRMSNRIVIFNKTVLPPATVNKLGKQKKPKLHHTKSLLSLLIFLWLVDCLLLKRFRLSFILQSCSFIYNMYVSSPPRLPHSIIRWPSLEPLLRYPFSFFPYNLYPPLCVPLIKIAFSIPL